MLNNPLVWCVMTAMIFVISEHLMNIHAEKLGIEYWNDLPRGSKIVRSIIFWNNIFFTMSSAFVTFNWFIGYKLFPKTNALDRYAYPVIAMAFIMFIIWVTHETTLTRVSVRLSTQLDENKLIEMKQSVQETIFENRRAISSNYLAGFPGGCFCDQLKEAEKTMSILKRIQQAKKK